MILILLYSGAPALYDLAKMNGFSVDIKSNPVCFATIRIL